MFVDEVKLSLASGKGGAGSVSFRRESMTPRGGPDGGDGGRGGHVIFRALPSINSLVDYRGKKKLHAQDGVPGAAANCTGADGEDLIVLVPVGTLVKDSETGSLLVDLDQEGDFVFLKGGRGGKGNHFFRTSVNQAPEHAQPGEMGEQRNILLELKLIADVGIIGLPNAGKSTLISRISAARPKIASYPFTTLTPHLGVVRIGDLKSFVVADIPGLIKGASQGVGLGIQFLRHVERTRFFIHLIDISSMDGVDPVSAYEDIQHEINSYDQLNQGKEGFFALTPRPQIVVLNKKDLLSQEQTQAIVQKFKTILGYSPYVISGVTGAGVSDLVQEVSRRVFAEGE